MSKKKKDTTFVTANIPQIATSGFVDFNTNKLYEQVYTGQFVCLNDDNKTYTYHKDVTVNDKDGLPAWSFIPMNNKVTKIKAIPLPMAPVEYNTTEMLVSNIDAFIYKYLDVSERFRKMSSWYIVMTWVKEHLNTINYLRALGCFGWGKSRFFDVTGMLCYKPIPFAGSVREATLFRLMDQWKGTLVLDECVIKDSDSGSDITQILNSGWQRGRYVWRCDQDNKNEVEPFDSFGPKVIASREKFDDQALNSRCITEQMKPTTRSDIPIELPPTFFQEQMILRNKLLMYRLRNWNKINSANIDKVVLPKNTSSRMKQLIMPFAVTFYDYPNVVKDLNKYGLEYYMEQVGDSSNTMDGGIVYAILLMHEAEGKNYITAQNILDKLNELNYEIGKANNVTIGVARANLGIKAESKSSGKYIVFEDALMKRLSEQFLTEDQIKYIEERKEMRLQEEQKMKDDNFGINSPIL